MEQHWMSGPRWSAEKGDHRHHAVTRLGLWVCYYRCGCVHKSHHPEPDPREP